MSPASQSARAACRRLGFLLRSFPPKCVRLNPSADTCMACASSTLALERALWKDNRPSTLSELHNSSTLWQRMSESASPLAQESKAYGTQASGCWRRASGLEGTKTLGRRLALRPPVATTSSVLVASFGLVRLCLLTSLPPPQSAPNRRQASVAPGRRTPLRRSLALAPVPFTPLP